MQISTAILASFQLTLLVLTPKDLVHRTSASIPSVTLSFVVALAICHVSFVEHRRSIRPSTLLNLYLLISLFCDIIQARTWFLLRNAPIFAAVCTAGIIIKLLLLVLEAQSKRAILGSSHRNLSPEETSGILNRAFLWWINSVLVTGYQKLLTTDDLPPLGHDLASDQIREKMQRAWDLRGT